MWLRSSCSHPGPSLQVLNNGVSSEGGCPAPPPAPAACTTRWVGWGRAAGRLHLAGTKSLIQRILERFFLLNTHTSPAAVLRRMEQSRGHLEKGFCPQPQAPSLVG